MPYRKVWIWIRSVSSTYQPSVTQLTRVHNHHGRILCPGGKRSLVHEYHKLSVHSSSMPARTPPNGAYASVDITSRTCCAMVATSNRCCHKCEHFIVCRWEAQPCTNFAQHVEQGSSLLGLLSTRCYLISLTIRSTSPAKAAVHSMEPP